MGTFLHSTSSPVASIISERERGGNTGCVLRTTHVTTVVSRPPLTGSNRPGPKGGLKQKDSSRSLTVPSSRTKMTAKIVHNRYCSRNPIYLGKKDVMCPSLTLKQKQRYQQRKSHPGYQCCPPKKIVTPPG